MSSILFTLKEAAYLWVRNFWYIALISLVIDAPIVGINTVVAAHLRPGSTPHPGSSLAWVSLALLLFIAIFSAIKMAAILGLLRRRLTGQGPAASILNSVASSTGRLFLVEILLCLLGLPIMLVGGFAMKLMGPLHIILKLTLALYFVFLGFALPEVFVVQEGKGAWGAIVEAARVAWRHLVYVAVSYLIVVVGVYVVGKALGHLPTVQMPWIGFAVQWARGLVSTFLIVLFWCIYLHLKDQENPAAEGHLQPSAD